MSPKYTCCQCGRKTKKPPPDQVRVICASCKPRRNPKRWCPVCQRHLHDDESGICDPCRECSDTINSAHMMDRSRSGFGDIPGPMKERRLTLYAERAQKNIPLFDGCETWWCA